jgi:hypothetical protein
MTAVTAKSSGSTRRIFVVGCPRSGTTVIQAMLASLPGVMSCGETHYFIRLFGQFDRWLREDPAVRHKWRKRLYLAKRKTHRTLQASIDAAFPHALDIPRLRRCLSGRGYIREFCRVLDRACLQQGDTCWVEKTPDHLAYVDLLAEHIPQASFLHVVRHGEDVLASAIDGQMRYSEHGVFDGGIPHWVARWNRAAGEHVRLAGDPRHIVLPYECLFTAPGEVRRLLRRLAGIDGDGSLLAGEHRSHIADLGEEPWKHGSTAGDIQPPRRKFEQVFGPVTRNWIHARLGDYRQVLAAVAAAQPELPWVASACDAQPGVRSTRREPCDA